MEFELSDEQLIDRMELNECRVANGLEPLDVNDIKERKCLKCDTPFLSMHKFNRVCDECYDENCATGDIFESTVFHLRQEEVLPHGEEKIHPFIAEQGDGVERKFDYKTFHQMLDGAIFKSHFEKLEEDMRPVEMGYTKGLVIRNTALLPGPCDITDLPQDILLIRSAMRRPHLQAFHVNEPLTPGQVRELDEALANGRSWVLIAGSHIEVDTEMFRNKVFVQ